MAHCFHLMCEKVIKQKQLNFNLLVMLQPFVPPKDLQEAIARLEAAEEKAAEAEFLQLALKEKSMEHTIE